MKKPRYTADHVEEVSARLRLYEEVLAQPEFQQLPWCAVCETVNDAEDIPPCHNCLFATSKDGKSCLSGPNGLTGGSCRTQDAQRRQFRFLKSQLRRNGWEFK